MSASQHATQQGLKEMKLKQVQSLLILLITTIFILLCGFKMSIMKKACVLKECICLIMVRFILDFANRSFSGKVHLPAALKLSLI